MQLDDRFYTSTEVAEILGVSLRSVYRYLEDGKLDAEIKTATGRHRFTKKNILDFLYPDGEIPQKTIEEKPTKLNVTNSSNSKITSQQTQEINNEHKVVQNMTEEEPEEIDWLSKFREAAAKFKQEQSQQSAQTVQTEQATVSNPEPVYAPEPVVAQPTPQPVYEKPTKVIEYYRSMLGGLKDIAQNIDKNSREGGIDYAFTMNAGLSLHKPIKPFAMLHVYFRNNHKDYYEKVLRLTPSDQSNAQLCVIYSDNENVYGQKEEVHGLFVVSKPQLHRDISEMGDTALVQELDAVFS